MRDRSGHPQSLEDLRALQLRGARGIDHELQEAHAIAQDWREAAQRIRQAAVGLDASASPILVVGSSRKAEDVR